ncbi:lim and transglutaminase domain protein ltd-1-like isoform X2 [Liolophura sinensis]|uniref:lim and transglutaminase domain protein ltd-1-like isoform X2 n=1 Tax=Liolophura sinensis TaxID=3198878 RepID=UPI0031587EAB
MGCGTSSQSQKKPKVDHGLDVQDLTVPCTEQGYPPPLPPKGRKADIYKPSDFKEIENNAINTPDIFLDSYDALIAHLTSDARNDLQKVRAIFVWLGIQNKGGKKGPKAENPDTPRAYLQLIDKKLGSYASMFALMCRKAKVPCVIIRGIGKSASYEVGDTDLDHLKNNWNAVFVAGNWRFVHTLWAYMSLLGHRSGNWTLVETGGVKTQEKQEASVGQLNFQLNDYWFLTDPEKLFISCFPDNPKWQLLERTRSLQEFKEVPFVRKAFHALGLKIKSVQKCLLQAEKGEASITIEVPKIHSGKIKLTYDLFFKDSEASENTVDNIQLDRFVFMNYRKQEVEFSIRFPVVGIYKISIFGHDIEENSETMDWLCDFRIDCSSAKEECQPLPDCPDIGWGPSVEAQQVGMEAITHQEGLIPLKRRQKLDIQFKLNRPTELRCEMLHNKIQKSDLKDFVTSEVTQKKASVKVKKLPEPGEYALKLNFRQAVSGKEFVNVVNYLIINPPEELPPPPKPKEPRRENPFLQNIRKVLKDAIEGNDMEQIERAMAAFLKQKLEDKGELASAQKRLEYLQLKKALHDAISRRHVDVLRVAIDNARNSEHVDELSPRPLKEAERLHAHLKSVDKSRHPILKLNQRTISEIASYKQPIALIKDVMTSTFLLLGEKKQMLEKWTYIQTLLRKTGKYNVKRRILVFDTQNLLDGTIEMASHFLAGHSMAEVSECSAGAGTFFKWGMTVETSVKETRISTTIRGGMGQEQISQ